MRYGTFAPLLVFTLIALPAVARADVMMPPPRGCPEGTEPRPCHGPGWCAPRPCAADADCADRGHCEERALCVGRTNCGGGWAPSEPVENAQTSCAGGAACPQGNVCQVLRVCIGERAPAPSTTTTTAPPATAPRSAGSRTSAGCDCRVSPAGRLGSGLAVLGSILAIAAASISARRRR